MAPRVGKKRKSSDEENLDLTAKCRHCDKNVPTCQVFQCSRNNRQHYGCVDCLRICAENIVFEGASNFDHERKAINCFKNKCTGVFPFEEVKIHLIPEMSAALNAVMTKFNCAVCFLDFSMKDGITCQKVDQTDENNESHTFCFECIKEFAATDEAVLAPGGVGLSCMQTECEHALMLNKIKNHLPSNVIKKLEERVMEENIGHAEIEGLQRCQKCNYAVEVIGGRYFVCICGHKQCIKCGDPFDNKKHNDFTCANKKRSKEEQTVDDQINDVVVRFCHKCRLQFVKSSGCNFMKCRCGATQCYICREKNITNDHFCKCPGLLEECKCIKRCRQFADSNQIDAHRIELLKSHINSGKKVSNQEILQSMPKHTVPDYEESDDDDDENDEEEEDEDFDLDSEGEENELNAFRQGLNQIRERIITHYGTDDEPTRAIPRMTRQRPNQSESSSSSDEEPSERSLRRFYTVRAAIPSEEEAGSSVRIEELNQNRLRDEPVRRSSPPRTLLNRVNSAPETRLNPAPRTLLSSIQPIRRPRLIDQVEPIAPSAPPSRRLTASTAASVSPLQRRVHPRLSPLIEEVPVIRRRPALPLSSSSSEDSSDENDIRISARRPFPLSSLFEHSTDESDAAQRNETINLDSSEDEDVIFDEDDLEESNEDEMDVDNDNETVQLDSSEDEEVHESVNASSEEEEIDSDDIPESADESSTQTVTVELPETDENESDDDMLIDSDKNTSDDIFPTSDDEVEYSSADEW